MMRKGFRLCILLVCIIPITTNVSYADDELDIQAVVTAYMKQSVADPGVYYDFTVILDSPYAAVVAAIGLAGNSSESFALSKTSGSWKILISGGGAMGISEFVEAGIPLATSQALQGSACVAVLSRNPPNGDARGRGMQFKTVSPLLRAAALRRGSSVLPRRLVAVNISGRIQHVTIIQPLSTRLCAL